MSMFVVAPAAAYHHHHHHHHHGLVNDQLIMSSPSSEHPIIPASPAGIHLWQPQPQPIISSSACAAANTGPTISYLTKPIPVLDAAAGILTGAGAGFSLTTCQDCGNQAKKDCCHRRCRTCCKSRGFDCSTHVKSTWVPAARRRERQLAAGSSTSTSATKKPRLSQTTNTTTSHTSTSTTPPRSFDTSSSHPDQASFRENLPGQVTAPAVFKCVRVTSVDDDGEDEYAYQAMVNIGGHVFKGFLYDQGVDDRPGGDGDINYGSSNIPNISELQLGGGGGGGGGGGVGGGAGDMFGGGGAATATSFGNPMN